MVGRTPLFAAHNLGLRLEILTQLADTRAGPCGYELPMKLDERDTPVVVRQLIITFVLVKRYQNRLLPGVGAL